MFPAANRLLVAVDRGGSTSSSIGLWATVLAAVANEIGVQISTAHFPPATSRWTVVGHSEASNL
jgi:hypothetical protein